MRSKLLAFLLPAMLAFSAMPVLAQNNGVTQEEEPHDARLEGYNVTGARLEPIVIKPAAGTAGTWFMTVALGVLCFGVMCKNGKRNMD